MTHPSGILETIPAAALYLFFRRRAGTSVLSALDALAGLTPEDDEVAMGPGFVAECGAADRVSGVREFPALEGASQNVPATSVSVWCWILGEDPGSLLHRGRAARSGAGSRLRTRAGRRGI